MTRVKRQGLGGSLLGQGQGSNVDAVLAQLATTPDGGGEREIAVGLVDRSPFQPRTTFDPATLDELAASIEANGLLQPIVVRAMPGGRYELLAGERRLLATKRAKRATIPVRVRQVDDLTAAAIGLTENLAREDLSEYDAARGIATLRATLTAAKRPATVRDLARLVGWSSSKVGRALQIADGLTPAVLASAVPRWDKLEQPALLTAAKAATPAEKRKVLRAAVARNLPEREAKARGVQGQPAGAPPYVLTAKSDGRLRLDLRRPVAALSPAKARALLDQLGPLVRQLQARAKAAR